MTFTRRTYRVAIRRAIRRENELRRLRKEARAGREILRSVDRLLTQTAHTARLQRRKRRERK